MARKLRAPRATPEEKAQAEADYQDALAQKQRVTSALVSAMAGKGFDVRALLGPDAGAPSPAGGTGGAELPGDATNPQIVELNREFQAALPKITDPAKQQMTILMTDQRMYMVRPIPAVSANASAGGAGKASGATLEKTGITEKIQGYDCTKYVVKDGNRTTEMWVTDQLGAFPGIGGGNPMAGGRGGPPPSSAWEEALKGKGFFPMRVSLLLDGKEVGRIEVILVEAHPVDGAERSASQALPDREVLGEIGDPCCRHCARLCSSIPVRMKAPRSPLRLGKEPSSFCVKGCRASA